jgi:tRNA threonylcarbamoyl adenosine modification protein YeaZ
LKLLLINSNPDSSFAAFKSDEEQIISYASDFPALEDGAKKLQNPDKLIFCLEQITQLCRKKNIELEDIDAVSVITGPGSFTGIRVELALAKGFADALGKKIIPINNFELTLNRLTAVSPDAEYLVLLPAKLPEFYFSIMKNFHTISEGCAELDKLTSIITKKTTIISDFPRESVKNLNYFDYINVKDARHERSRMICPVFDSMISLSLKYFNMGKMYESEKIKPLYLKEFSFKVPTR